MGFEIASISKLVPSSHQNCSHLSQVVSLITKFAIAHMSQLVTIVKIGQNFHNYKVTLVTCLHW